MVVSLHVTALEDIGFLTLGSFCEKPLSRAPVPKREGQPRDGAVGIHGSCATAHSSSCSSRKGGECARCGKLACTICTRSRRGKVSAGVSGVRDRSMLCEPLSACRTRLAVIAIISHNSAPCTTCTQRWYTASMPSSKKDGSAVHISLTTTCLASAGPPVACQ